MVTFESIHSLRQRSNSARPFLRWAGGKGYALPHLSRYLPPITGRYIEPFMGGGSVFFHIVRNTLGGVEAWLGDINQPLISCYEAVRDRPHDVASALEALQSNYLTSSDQAAFYYEMRDLYNSSLPAPAPELFIFLNRTCWNGLYRVNQRGHFNVPHGGGKPATFPSLNDLLNASAALANAHLRCAGWQSTLATARPGDFVYLDPPYYSDLLADRGKKYQKEEFGVNEHERLARHLAVLADGGVNFVLSNSAEEPMVDLYRSYGFSVDSIQVRRAINSDASGREAVSELVVRPSWTQPVGGAQSVLSFPSSDG